MRLSPTRVSASAAAGALLLAGCNTEAPDVTVEATETTIEPTTTVEPTTTTTATAESTVTPTITASPPTDEEPPGEEAPFPADRAADRGQASANASLSPEILRFGAHDGYDRVVLDLRGTGEPGWLGEYVSDPRMAGSGNPVDIAGDAFLQVSVDGVVYPTEPGAIEYVGQERFQPSSASIIEEVVYGGVFEGQAEIYIGLSSDQPFRVFRTVDGKSVVIDIQHA
ncbi:hypothetical protein LGT39_06075 [Demequina sp. TTPB684]|uniref:AMIN-like domain-containing (lipo)protein n=1 Tax=unclassified Demequina TaxID=2620311 RepID=UPI001CF22BCB|nr:MULTISPECIES: hypothetical protein [unclassified Demequina]MCB2412415.1 hypothetical protein [Demequina sp. TTPB684]UPU89501.1 hypothetical protein LGT36_006120 [Demequina sp. TMPB413]